MNPQLESIADRAAEDLRDMIREAEPDILTAIHKAVAEAQLQESKPKFCLSYKIAVDYDKSVFNCDLSWSMKQNRTTSHTIEDPLQGKLSIETVAKEFVANMNANNCTVTIENQ